MTAYSVTELRDAWRALDSGQFTRTSQRSHVTVAVPPVPAWQPSLGERVVAVVGCAGGVGASTVALALATATGVPARVVECCPPIGSGLSAAATAELGVADGWLRGSRGIVLLERPTGATRMMASPVSSSVDYTILDADWTALTSPNITWVSPTLATLDQIVLVTSATVPGLRRLESCAAILGRDALAVIVGPSAKRWPRPVKIEAAGLTARVQILDFPLDPRLHVTGLTPDPLPAPLLKAAENMLAVLRKETS